MCFFLHSLTPKTYILTPKSSFYINCEPRYDQKYIFRKRMAPIWNFVSIFFFPQGSHPCSRWFWDQEVQLNPKPPKNICYTVSQNRVWWISTRLWPLKTSKCEINILIHSILWKRPYQHIPWPLKPIFWHQNQVSISIVSQDMTKSIFFENE